MWLDTEVLYEEILETLISMSGVKDEWEGPEVFPLAVKAGLSVHYRAARIESRYIFGTDEIGFFLQTDFSFAENIRKMNDDFWFMMGEACLSWVSWTVGRMLFSPIQRNDRSPGSTGSREATSTA